MVESTATAEQARRNLLQIAREIQRLAESPLPAPDFFRQFLRLVLQAVNAPAGVVWLPGPDGRVGIAAEQGLREAGLAEEAGGSANRSLLQDALSTGQARCVVPDAASGGPAVPGLIVLAPVHRGDDCVGAVEVFQRPNTPEEARKGYLQFVEQMTGYASRFLTNRERQRAAGSGDEFWRELAELSFQMQTTRKPAEVATVAANDGRLMLKADRVSVACRRGRKLRVEAVSGLEAVNHRSNLVRSMGRLARRVLPMKRTFTFVGNVEELPAELKKPLADFVAESGCRMLMIVPLFEPDPLVKPGGDQNEFDAPQADRDKQTPFGCLIIERFSEGAESSTRQELNERAGVLSEQVAASLANARAFHRIFLRSVFGTIGRARELMYGRRLLKTLAALTLVAAVVLALVFIKWDYRVEAKGQLMPTARHAVFAPWDGEVAEVFVKGGKHVSAGDPLLRIRNDELDAKLVSTRNSLDEKRQQRRGLQAQIDDVAGRLQPEDRIRLQGQLAEVIAAIGGLEAEEKILAKRVRKLTLTAPITGVVATFRVEEMLDRRPVQRGEVLLEVMDDKGPWRLELDVEERRMGHLLRAQQEAGERLPLEFVLATDPTETYNGTLQQISTRPKRLPERGSLVEVFAAIDDDKPLERRIGAEVTAKIDCGERALGYVIFGDFIEFVRGRWWL